MANLTKNSLISLIFHIFEKQDCKTLFSLPSISFFMRNKLCLFIVAAALLIPSFCHAQFPAHYLPEYPTFQKSDFGYFYDWVSEQLNLADQTENQVHLEIFINQDGSLIIESLSSIFDDQWNAEFENLIKSSESYWAPGAKQDDNILMVMSFPDKSGGLNSIAISQYPIDFPGEPDPLTGECEVEVEPIPFMLIEKPATFRGKDYSAFNQWVQKHKKYPVQAKEAGMEGTVWVLFTVNTEGAVEQVEVLEGANPILDEEAVRVVSSSPKWKPFMQRGRTCPCKLYMPVEFKLK